MHRVIFSSADLYISHLEFIRLSERKEISLGIDELDAAAIPLSSTYAPKGTAVRAAFFFWHWCAIIAFLCSIYASFVNQWWWFVVGFVVMLVVHRANKQGNTKNILDSARFDKEFYEQVARSGKWLYKLHPDLADKYKRS